MTRARRWTPIVMRHVAATKSQQFMRLNRIFLVRPMAQRALVLSTLSLAAWLAAAGARAGEAAPTTGDDARCAAEGEGFVAAPGSSACVRFSGYIAAGAGFETAPRPPGAFQASAPPVVRAEAGVAFDGRMNTPMGPLRAYIEVHRPGFSP